MPKTNEFIKSIFILLVFIFGIQHTTNSQNKTLLQTKTIDSLMLVNDMVAANSLLDKQLLYLKINNLNDSLYKYVYYVGKIELSKSNAQTASKKAEAFIEDIKSKTNNKTTQYQALLKLADFYDEIGENQKSLSVTKSALDIVKQVVDATPEATGKVEYNIGATYLSLGNLDEAKKYFQNALRNFESYPQTSKPQLSDGYNAVGAIMWMSSKLDSAKHYYSKAIKTIESAEGDPLLNLYLGTVIQSNVSLLEYSQGNLAEAINIQNNVIVNFETVAKNYTDENIVSKAKRFQYRAISNMAVFYNEQGNLEKAYDILKFAYDKKKHLRESNDSDLGSTLIQLGQSKLSLKDYDEAIAYLEKGVKHFNVNAIKNPYWKAAGLHALAEAYTAKKNVPLAKTHYEESERLFKEALGNVYDAEFLSFLRNKSLFMAESNEPKKALNTALNAYDYVLKNGGEDNFSLLKQLITLAEVNYKIGDYNETLLWIEKANTYLNKTFAIADAKYIDFNKPKLILLKSLAEYELDNEKSTAFLDHQLLQLDKAINILEERKTTIYKNEDINILMSDYQEISNFSKQLALERYQKTNDSAALDKIIELHESGLYNRIRSRLNLKNNISFTDIPEAVLQRETALKQEMATSLSTSEGIETFLLADTNWSQFLDTLKTDYPKYYKMRYATIEEPIGNIQNTIANNTTVVRYLYIEKTLYALIITKTDKHIVKLSPNQLKKHINTLTEEFSNSEITFDILHKLYQQLWFPFEDKIDTKFVVIIPDGQLFNLSFESLTPNRINSYSDMATQSLLSKYIISYNYSLHLVKNNGEKPVYNANFIAFAPEFSNSMKSEYKLAINDSLHTDKAYLTLLPQPFTKDLARVSSKLFDGESFLNEKASKQIFTSNAKEHKIIHIGTHAESNNISPELSRLIFAKTLNDSLLNSDNSLYTYEIYNQNLSSNLAILTACETGKPTYQAGEGMISLAHAFNYAGSESMLTSLWKIDEQSSAEIIKTFYSYLKEGVTKDEALQKAKLDYISTAKGRTIYPQYWAGLVLIGDTAPVDLNSSSNHLIYWVLGLIAFILLVVFIKRRQ